MERTYSIIGSAGRTATTWMTIALNCHRDVFFVHGFDLDPRKAGGKHGMSTRILRDTEAADDLVAARDHHDRYFDIIEAFNDQPVIGTVHSLFPHFVGPPPRRAYITSCIVRHPLRRVQSFLAKTGDLDATNRHYIDNWAEGNKRYIAERCERVGIEPTLDVIHFMFCCHTVFFYDSLGSKCNRLFRMEDLVSGPEKFSEFFRHVAGQDADSDPLFWDRFARVKPIEVLASIPGATSGSFSKWPRWQRAIFVDELYSPMTLEEYRAVDVRQFSFDSLAEFYQGMGYDFECDPQDYVVRPPPHRPRRDGAQRVLAHLAAMMERSPDAAADAGLGLLHTLLAPPPTSLPGGTAAFTANGSIPVATVVIDGRNFNVSECEDGQVVDMDADAIIFSRDAVSQAVAQAECRGQPAHARLYQALDHFPISGRRVVIAGSENFIGEAVTLAFGGQPFSLPVVPRLTDDDRLSIMSPRQEEGLAGSFDAALAINLGGVGLGRYGEPLDPDGDLNTLRRVRALLRPGGLAYVGIFVGTDILVWNVNRHYGPIRAPMLLAGWEIVGLFGDVEATTAPDDPRLDAAHFATPIDGKGFAGEGEVILVLRSPAELSGGS